ncbi:MAG: hypothetical protein QW197_03095 [Candidatus Aenigmatarchaeota archaeon]
MDFNIVFLILTSILSFSIGGILVSVIFILSSRHFASDRFRKILIFQVISLIFLTSYFFLQIFSFIFPEFNNNMLVIVFKALTLILTVVFLIYTSTLLYELSIEIGFGSPKNKEKIKKILQS